MSINISPDYIGNQKNTMYFTKLPNEKAEQLKNTWRFTLEIKTII